MKAVEYSFDDIKTEKESKYIFQITNGRKLSEIYHSHDFYEIILVISGGCLHIINGRECFMESGDFIFLRSRDCHMFKEQMPDTNLIALSVEKYEFLKFAEAYGSAFFDRLNMNRMPECFEYGDNLSEICNCCSVCLAADSEDYEYKFLLSLLIKKFIDAALKDNIELPQNLQRAVKALKYQENLKIGIDAMVKISNYSHTQLARLMKKHMHITLQEYVQNVRLETAYNYIIFTSERLEEIAEKVGYASFSHFNIIFKNKFGITPAALRKRRCICTV